MRSKREKVVQSRAEWRKEDQVRKIRTYMTVVAVTLCFSVAAGAIFAWNQFRSRAVPPSAKPAVSAADSEAEEQLPVYDDSYNLLLVNANVALAEDFSPDLVSVAGVEVDAKIVPALEKMMADAKAEGCALTLSGGYVSKDEQDRRYQAEVQRLAKAGQSRVRAESEAMKSVGRGGYNENQTGMAVTFSAGKGESFADSDQYNWLIKNCVNYGFVLRYPKGKDSVTGMSYNPAHFRYVGTDNAVSMRRLSMSLEEYVSYISQQKGS